MAEYSIEQRAQMATNPPAKRRGVNGKENRPSLSLKKRRKTTETKRFTFVNPEEVEAEKDKFIPQNTDKSTQWAIKAFTDWLTSRSEAGEQVPPENILLTDDRMLLCNWLCTIFIEVRKMNGTKYCPRSLSALLAGIHRHIETHSPHRIQIQRQEEFEPLRTLLDNLYRKLHSEGVGTTKNQAEVISLHEEKQLWDTSSLSHNTPQGLLMQCSTTIGLIFVSEVGQSTEICMSHTYILAQIQLLETQLNLLITLNTARKIDQGEGNN